MMWSDLPYSEQLKILDKINNILDYEQDPSVKIGLSAAIDELKIWSNSPYVLNEEQLIVYAQDIFEEANADDSIK
jgi:hypothetical protein